MPFFTVPFAIKVAIAAGATVAIIKNQDIILEKGQIVFEAAAKFCKNRLEESKMKNGPINFADEIEDNAFSDKAPEKENVGRSTGSNLRENDSDYDNISTPETTDFSEIDTDYEPNDYEEDDDGDYKQQNHGPDHELGSGSETIGFASDTASLD
ncbi:uncharacterized protein KGF55_004289 [Candida pseudojiufengensis]|uniref:uncharacterized protein n=1 Tax=Candida pseudojiufengensis TaxID=497109 RepID=UPI0022249021|nr:uncharacterized protein KGF55_004289 [Candida pseudojiufengensis]KAI5961022.1 hypothetical protein KGF55_004289 [Candida pseudojiufengensis]